MSELRFACIRCGDCCRQQDLLITVTGRDIVRISQALDLDEEALLRALDFYTVLDRHSIPAGLEQFPHVATERGSAFIALKKMEDGSCVFLKEDQCMIHTFRPGVCRAFPFTFSQSEDGLKFGLSAKKEICPGLGEGDVVSSADLEEVGLSVTEDIQIFEEFAEDWNHHTSNPLVSTLIERIIQDVRFYV
jgi:Fe-S-cluster containining protein